jgi:membrane protease YdiL (CAAX protease family)
VQISPGWKPEHFETIVVLLSFSILYLIYHYSILLQLFNSLLKIFNKKEISSESPIARKVSGVLLLGLFPFLIATLVLKRQPDELGISLLINGFYFIPVFIICALIFPVLLRGSKTLRDSRTIYREKGKFLIDLILWIPYIIAYEFSLRGFLLFPLEQAIGSWPAIATVTAIYTAIHLTREKSEAAGSLIMGIIFGFFALSTRSIIIPIIIHTYIAITTELLLHGKSSKKMR